MLHRPSARGRSGPQRGVAIITLAAAVLLSLGCGGDTAITSTAPTPTPAAAPAPPPPPAPPPDPVRPEPPAECAPVLEAVEGNGALLLDEWWHTPFPVNYYDHFPVDVVGPDYVPGQLAIVRGLADQIEAQLGYPVIEAGEIVPAPEGWTQDSLREEVCRDYREPGEIVAVHLEETLEDHPGGGALTSLDVCGIVPYWVGDGIPEDSSFAGFMETAVTTAIFQLLGFGAVDSIVPHVQGSDSLFFPWDIGLDAFAATEEDIAALGCLYPEPPE